jgi:hypothetical protein
MKDNSPQAVKLLPRIDAEKAHAIMKKTGVRFSCTPEGLAAWLTQVLRWYAIDQHLPETVTRMANGKPPLNRKRAQELLELPADAFRPRGIWRAEEEPELLKIPRDAYDWWSPATDRMDTHEREAAGLLRKPDKKTKRRIHRLLDTEDKGGRPENWALRSLVLRLADIYEDFTDRKAGVSINRDGEIVGPFVRFAVAVIESSGPYLPRAVRAALQARKKLP